MLEGRNPEPDDMGVSKNRGTPKSCILVGISIINFINHPFWGTPIFGNTHMDFDISILFLFMVVWFHT